MDKKMPIHIAIIPDGNRRWAKEKGLPTFQGHKKGLNNIIPLCNKAREMGIKTLTFWGFSTENWKRSKEEVAYLMQLFEQMIDMQIREAHKYQTRIIHLGRKDRFPPSLQKKIIQAEDQTKSYSNFFLAIALDYGGQDEILRTIKKIKNNEEITDDLINKSLDTKDLPQPSPDLIIRTSGECRTSGFMIWQSVYSEYVFINTYFPEFDEHIFEQTIKSFSTRDRRFGT